jgi:hypothetical protein
MADDNEHRDRQDISHTVSMLRRLSTLEYDDDNRPGLPFKFYLGRYEIFIEIRKALDRRGRNPQANGCDDCSSGGVARLPAY